MFIYLSFLCQCLLASALICPFYPPNQHDSLQQPDIEHCQNHCSFQSVLDGKYACAGIYHNSSGQILIKQLGAIANEDACSSATRCQLEMDSFNNQIFTCCCSTGNCTLNWTSIPRIRALTTPPTSSNRPSIIRKTFVNEKNSFSWQLSLILSISILFLVVLAFVLSFCGPIRHQKHEEKAKPKLGPSRSIENLFFSAQQSVLGKNSIIYKGYFHEQVVALKVYQPTHVLVWTNEMMLLKSIQHPSIIKILSDGQCESHLYLVLPFYENGTLQTYLRAPHRTLPFHRCLVYLRSLASAVAYLHFGQKSSGTMIVHRDIKSSNVLVADNGVDICLIDFGMATALPKILTEKDFLQIGTLRYMAPELLEGVISHTAEALCSVDMYALALVMWEIMSQCSACSTTGYRPPYDEYLTNTSDRSSFTAQLYDLVVVRRIRPSLDWPIKDLQYSSGIHEISKLIDACWTADPDLRMNAQTLAFKLDQIIE